MSSATVYAQEANLFNPSMTFWKVGTGDIQRPASKSTIGWFKEKFEQSLRIDVIYEICSRSISVGKYDDAIETILNEIHKRCEILAEAFGKAIMGRAYVSDLIEQLRQEGQISEEDSNRLSVIIIAIDGLEIEVREYGGSISQEDLDYILEFHKIISNILQENYTSLGISLPSFVSTSYNVIQTTETGISASSHVTNIDEFIDCIYAWNNTNSFAVT